MHDGSTLPAAGIELHGPYRPRSVRFLELWRYGGWRLKVYGIVHAAPGPCPDLVAAVKRVAAPALPEPARSSSRYGLGFVCAHQGRTASVGFVDWWEQEDELHHVMFVGSHDGGFRPARAGELTACAWDLALIGFERDAWVDAILRNPAGPDPEAYLSAQMNEDV